MPLALYRTTPQMDMFLSKVYTDIVYAGDGEKVLGERMQSLFGFLSGCQPPNICILGFDAGPRELNGAWMWTLMEPCYDGGFFSMWIRPEKRRTKQAFALAWECYERFFDEFPVLLGVTHQEDLLEEHQRLGYTLLGKVRNLKQGQDVWIMTIHKEDFLARKSEFADLIAAINARSQRVAQGEDPSPTGGEPFVDLNQE